MIDIIAKLFLSFSHETIILPLIILGYIWLDREVFYHATCLILTSMIFNFALKVTFQVPLSPLLGKEGFAFPSGHMQSSVVLYGWIILKTSNIFCRLLMITLLIGVGLSLVHFGYHNYYDVAAGAFFALLLMALYYFILLRKQRILPWAVFIATTGMMLYINATYKIIEGVWMAYYGLLGIMLSERIFAKNHGEVKTFSKILSTITCIVSVLLIKAIFSIQIISALPAFLNQTQWAMIGFCIPFSVFFPKLLYFFRK